MLPLFEHWPALESGLPILNLATLPTPIAPMTELGADLDVEGLYIKRDDFTGEAYGGNKVRKLDFLLGKAKAEGIKTVLTFGAAGSNHALATAIYTQAHDLHCISILVPQHNAHSVRRNLLRGHVAGAELHHCVSKGKATLCTANAFRREFMKQGCFPMVIPPGGSAPLGVVGYVNAALELKAQVEAGEMPEPDVVYVASGTMGTCIGLLLGFALAGMKTRVVGVAVTTAPYTEMKKGHKLYQQCLDLMRVCDPTIPDIPFPQDRFSLPYDFLGEDYALYTEAGCAAVKAIKEKEGVPLEGTYTGKALSGLLAHAQSGALAGQQVLFWDTYNSKDVSPEIERIDYHDLPRGFHQYFEEEVQELDRQ